MTAPAPFAGLIDLAAERLGGRALEANDEFFAPKENLLKPGRGISKPDEYTDRGKWMDGWETRRRRTPGHDWCLIRLGLPGIIRSVNIDTHHFLGNHPTHASLDAGVGDPTGSLPTGAQWVEILPRSPLAPDLQNMFPLDHDQRWTHVRLNIYPDGGVARLRTYGMVAPDWASYAADTVFDLAAVEHGGLALDCSDMFFSTMQNLIMPGPAQQMGDGWETKRRRGPGHDWVIIRLGRPGTIEKVVVETTHFKGNYPDQCSLQGCFLPDTDDQAFDNAAVAWRELLPKSRLAGNSRHEFTSELADIGDSTHLRLNIYPDGGIARLRAFGLPDLTSNPPVLPAT